MKMYHLLDAVQQVSHGHHVERKAQPVGRERFLKPDFARVAFRHL